MTRTFILCLLLCLLGSACGGDATPGPDLAAVDKAATCAATFGTALTAGVGRLDGTIRAVVPPGHPTCAQPNSDHLVLQVDAGGATYRMVVNVASDRPDADPRVRLATVEGTALVGPPFAEGWHLPAGLDYVQSLAMHSEAFVPHEQDELVRLVTDELVLGAPVSVYATTSGGSSAHLVHRNAPGEDGAIVIGPATSPRWLLFSFSTQAF